MKTIGLIGGMSWESSIEYYRIINEEVRKRLGGLHSAKCIMYSVDFAEIEKMQQEARWKDATAAMVDAAKHLERGGADIILICTNTMHKMADDVQKKIKIPLLNIADAAAAKIREKGMEKVGLLGTKFTMEQDFYKGRLVKKHSIAVIIPDEKDRQIVHDIIFKELCCGQRKADSKAKLKKIISKLVEEGAEGIVLGCTELPLILSQKDFKTLIFDTMEIHAIAAVDFALG